MAPAILAQVDPLQSCHWYANEPGSSSHAPFEVLSVWPSTAVPLTDGASAFVGGSSGGTGGSGVVGVVPVVPVAVPVVPVPPLPAPPVLATVAVGEPMT